jgi:hypothetical protein
MTNNAASVTRAQSGASTARRRVWPSLDVVVTTARHRPSGDRGSSTRTEAVNGRSFGSASASVEVSSVGSGHASGMTQSTCTRLDPGA